MLPVCRFRSHWDTGEATKASVAGGPPGRLSFR